MAVFDAAISLDSGLLPRSIGLLGVCLYVGGFFALCTGKLTSATPPYFLLIFTASTCVLISLTEDFNLSAALIQSFYIVMSLGGILFRWRSWRAKSSTPP